jgi:hypothetical protein
MDLLWCVRLPPLRHIKTFDKYYYVPSAWNDGD